MEKLAYNKFIKGKCKDLGDFQIYCSCQYEQFYLSGHEQNHEYMFTTFLKSFGNTIGEFYHKKVLENLVSENLEMKELTFPQLIQFLEQINSDICDEAKAKKEIKKVQPILSAAICSKLNASNDFAEKDVWLTHNSSHDA